MVAVKLNSGSGSLPSGGKLIDVRVAKAKTETKIVLRMFFIVYFYNVLAD